MWSGDWDWRGGLIPGLVACAMQDRNNPGCRRWGSLATLPPLKTNLGAEQFTVLIQRVEFLFLWRSASYWWKLVLPSESPVLELAVSRPGAGCVFTVALTLHHIPWLTLINEFRDCNQYFFHIQMKRLGRAGGLEGPRSVAIFMWLSKWTMFGRNGRQPLGNHNNIGLRTTQR